MPINLKAFKEPSPKGIFEEAKEEYEATPQIGGGIKLEPTKIEIPPTKPVGLFSLETFKQLPAEVFSLNFLKENIPKGLEAFGTGTAKGVLDTVFGLGNIFLNFYPEDAKQKGKEEWGRIQEVLKPTIEELPGYVFENIAETVVASQVVKSSLLSVPKVASFASKFPKVYDVVTTGLTGVALGQLDVTDDATWQDRLKTAAIDFSSWSAWSLVGGVPAKKVYYHFPAYFTIGYTSSLLEGQSHEEAIVSGLSSATISSLFRLTEIPKSTQNLMRENAVKTINKYNNEVETNYARDTFEKSGFKGDWSPIKTDTPSTRIKENYNYLAHIYHPHLSYKYGISEQIAQKKFIELTTAYDILSKSPRELQRGIMQELQDLWKSITRRPVPAERAIIPAVPPVTPTPPTRIVTAPPTPPEKIKVPVVVERPPTKITPPTKVALSKEATTWLQKYTRAEEKISQVLPSKEVIEELSKYKMEKSEKLYRGIREGESEAEKKIMSFSGDKEIAKLHAREGGKVVSRVVKPEETLVDTRKMPLEEVEATGVIPDEEEVIVAPELAKVKPEVKPKVKPKVKKPTTLELREYAKEALKGLDKKPSTITDFTLEEKAILEKFKIPEGPISKSVYEGMMTKMLREKVPAARLITAKKKGIKIGKKLTKEEIKAKIQAKKLERKEANKIRKAIGFQRHIKELSNKTISRIKTAHKIEKGLKQASSEELKVVLEEAKKLKKGDKFLTRKQIKGLEHYIKEGKFDKDPLLITKREMVEKFKEQKDLFESGLMKFLTTYLFPTVDIKEGHPVIEKVVDETDIVWRDAMKKIKAINEDFNKIVTRAERSRKQGIFKRETGKRIFQRMSGEDVELTPEEMDAVTYLRDYFEKARKDLKLERYRQNYITHLEEDLLEKVVNKGLIKAIQDYMKPKDTNIPVDIMLALDHIMGSEKFFRFALKRKGIVTPTKNIRRILREYSSILETKKALDKVLPEAQASQQLLLKRESSIWMKRFIQNMKGRALDFDFRMGKMGWISRLADRLIDFGYIRLLSFNYWSALKNVVGGESTSLAYQAFGNYLKGKYRLIVHPKKANKIITDSGLLEGSYVDIASQNIVKRGKKWINGVLYAGYQIGEYELRGSYFLGELTNEEWKTGEITPERFREILDGIAITQGIYTKVDSPLFAQTTLGRTVMQFARWRIVNAMLVKRIAGAAVKDAKAGKWKSENIRKLLKVFFITAAGLYLEYQLAAAGYKKAKQAAGAAAELLRNIIKLVSMETIYDMIANNPLVSTLGDFAYTMQQLLNYVLGDMIIEEPSQLEFRHGIEETYVTILRYLGVQKSKEKKKAPIIKFK